MNNFLEPLPDRGQYNIVVIDGPDGSGKTTLVRELARRAGNDDRETVVVRTPGATEAGRKIRDILLSFSDKDEDPLAMAYLFFADFTISAKTLIAPAVSRGALLILDRFYLSTLVYQYYRYPRDERNEAVYNFAANQLQVLCRRFDLRPLHIILTGLTPEMLADRIRQRGSRQL